MEIVWFEAVNCFGFGTHGRINLKAHRNFIYLLGRNSSGKTSLLQALAHLDPSRIPADHRNFENFEPLEATPVLRAQFEIPPTKFHRSDVSRVVRAGLLRSGIRQGEILADLRLVQLLANVEEAYLGLIDSIHAEGAVLVERRGDGDYAFGTAKVPAAEERQAHVGRLLTNFAPASKFTLGDREITIGLTAEGIESALFRIFPEVFLFDARYPLDEDLPDRLEPADLENSSPLTDAFVEYLGAGEILTMLESNDPELQDGIRQDFNAKLGEICKLVNRFGSRSSRKLLEMEVSLNKAGLQITARTGRKKSFYRHLSPNTKMLFAYHLYKRDDLDGEGIILFDEPNIGFHASAQRPLLSALLRLADRGNKVLVSTHSEHLIDLDLLAGVRLLDVDRQRMVSVRNDYRNRIGTKAEPLALQPILDAIGLRYTRSLARTDKLIVVEGLTDFFFIRGFERVLNKGNKLGGGARQRQWDIGCSSCLSSCSGNPLQISC